MDISKLMDLIGLGDDKPEDLETAMEKQLLPDLHHGKSSSHASSKDDALFKEALEENASELPDKTRLIKVGRCPSCGDQIMARADQPCAWCDTSCRPDQDGFHLVHIALGSFQERHCFCSDECYEAFRRMYPARVHRNCYERPCKDCNYCIKRYVDESDGFTGQEQEPRPQADVTPEKA